MHVANAATMIKSQHCPPAPEDGGAAICNEQFGRSIDASLTALRDQMAEALATVRLPAGRRRSSLNDIGRRASEMAKALRAAPPSVEGKESK